MAFTVTLLREKEVLTPESGREVTSPSGLFFITNTPCAYGRFNERLSHGKNGTRGIYVFKIVAIVGSPSLHSRTRSLVVHVQERVARRFPNETSVVDVAQLLPGLVARSRDEVSPEVAEALLLVEQADLLLVGTPVYKGSYTGLFKHFIDLLDYKALNSVVVGLLATGGSDRHALVIEHQLRPLFGFFTLTLCRRACSSLTVHSSTGAYRILPSSAVSMPLPIRLFRLARHVLCRSPSSRVIANTYPYRVVHDESISNPFAAVAVTLDRPVGLERRSRRCWPLRSSPSGAQARTRVSARRVASGSVPSPSTSSIERGFYKEARMRQRS